MRGRRGRVIGICAVVVAALAPSTAGAQEQPLATCFWEGPISTQQPTTRGFDGRNFNFPEESATYWLARFSLPAGSRLVLRGRYPHGRYMSFNAYADGAPTDALSDIAIAPEPGAVNPFVAGARRDGDARDWAVTVVDEAVPAGSAPRAPNTLYAKTSGGAPIELAYRVYEPDRGLDLTGGTGLPEVELIRRDGTALRGEEACPAVNDPDRSITVQTISPGVWQAATSAPGCNPATTPAYDPVRWERFFNIDYASLSVPFDCTAAGFAARRAITPSLQGGFYSNRDSAYVFAHLSRRFGPVLMVEGTLPVHPRTSHGEPVMEAGQLRFWSLCTGESRVTTRTPDCLADRQIPIDDARRFVIAVSRAEDRPANATDDCGFGWLDWGQRGDGAGRPDYGLLIMRNMLVDPGFAEAIQRVGRPGEEPRVMGPYFPRSRYIDRAGFESLGCPRTARVPGPGIEPPASCATRSSVTLTIRARRGTRLRRVIVFAPGGRRLVTVRLRRPLVRVRVRVPLRRAGLENTMERVRLRIEVAGTGRARGRTYRVVRRCAR